MNKENISVFLSVLICSITFTILSYFVYTNTMSDYLARKEQNPFHATLDKTISYKEAIKFENLNNIKSVGITEIPKSARISNHILSVIDENDVSLEKIKDSFLTEGTTPKNSDEIILSANLKDELDLNIGDIVTLEYGNRIVNGETINPTATKTKYETFEIIKDKDYKIVGFTKRVYGDTKMISSASSLISDYGSDYFISLEFNNIYKSYEIKDRVLEYARENINQKIDIEMNTELLRFFGVREEDGFFVFRLLIDIMTFLVIAIVLAFMIKNIFNIWAIYKIKELSMYKSIGATDFQIYKLLLKESLIISIIPMILGQVIGFLITKYMYIYRFEVNNIFDKVTMTVKFNPIVGICIFILTFLTIMLAIISPARRISKINIIEGLSGNLKFKDYKKKYGNTLFKELTINNRKTLKSQIYVMVAGLFIIMGMLTLVSVNTVNTNYSYYDRDYNITLSYRTNDGDYLEVFDELISNINVEKSSIHSRKYIYFKFNEMEFSDEFNEIGFDRDFLDESNLNNNSLDAWIYGYEESAFKDIGGSGDEVLLLNTVQKDPTDDIMGAKHIPYFKSPYDIKFRFLEDGKDYNLQIDKPISDLKEYGERPEIYGINIITSIENFNKIIELGKKEYFDRDKNFPVTNYYLDLKVNKDDIHKVSQYINTTVKNSIRYDESYTLKNSVMNEQLFEREKKSLLFFALTLVAIVIFLNIANSYSTTNLSFFNRRTEIGTLLSCGMEKSKIEKMLKKEIIIQLIKATILAIVFTIILIYTLSKMQPIATFIKIMSNIRYSVLIFAILIIFLSSYLIYIFAMREITRKEDIINLIK